jgi:predicted DNA-binding transcriptional regulator YafY
MRADRLLAILMLLQARGRMTAAKLADELEVSCRTIYRDIDSLSVAGVPVYAERGRTGGFALLDSYRTTLTGLTEDELQALFMLSIPAPLVELGFGDEVEAAIRKISAAVPAARRVAELRVRDRIYIDPEPWLDTGDHVPHLAALQAAVWEDRRTRVTRELRFGAELSRLLDPMALVAKGGAWFLVAHDHGRLVVHPVSEIRSVDVTEARFDRPGGFDLPSFWSDWCARQADNRPKYLVTVRMSPDLLPQWAHVVGERGEGAIVEAAADAFAATVDRVGWTTATLRFETFYSARAKLLSQGSAIEVIRPIALRESVADFARQTLGMYDATEASDASPAQPGGDL